MTILWPARSGAWMACLTAALAAGAQGADTAGQAPAIERPAVSLPAPEADRDATLNDVRFISDRLGWAVGAVGTVLHTEDGGLTWTPQAVPPGYTYHAVFFLDDRLGWIVGGAPVPHTPLSQGIVLHTLDGGRHWSLVPSNPLPRLRDVVFLDSRSGVALGEATPANPTGLWITTTRGQRWSPGTGLAGGEALAGAFADLQTGAVVGSHGYAAAVRQGVSQPAQMDPTSADLWALCMPSRTVGYAVGTGGLVLRTQTGGHTWGALPLGVGPLQASVDLFAVHFVDEQTGWAAGAPGSVVWHTTDAGRTWQAQRTGQTAPIRALWFHDRHRGWAVGELGTILVTQDGGQTWVRARTGGTRCPLVGVWSGPEAFPTAVLARYAGEEGYLTAVIAGRPGAGGPNLNQTADALRLCGVSSFRSLGALAKGAAGRDSAGLTRDGSAEAGSARGPALVERLVMVLRTYRPSVVIAGGMGAAGPEGVDSPVTAAVEAAVEAAGRADAFPDQLRVLGLEPWAVRKCYVRVVPAKADPLAAGPSAVHLDPHEAGPRWLRTFADVGRLALECLGVDPAEAVQTSAWALAVSRLARSGREQGLFHGVFLGPGTDGRRPWALSSESALAEAGERARRWRQFEALRRLLGQRRDWDGLLFHVADFLQREQVESDRAGEVLYAAGRHLLERGQWAQGMELLRQVVEGYPDSPAAPRACADALVYFSSSEALHVMARQRQPVASETRVTAEGLRDLSVPGRSAGTERPGQARKADASPSRRHPRVAATRSQTVELDRPAWSPSEAAWRYGMAVELGQRLQRLSPVMAEEPWVVFSLASAHRHLKQGATARQLLAGLAGPQRQGPWAENARRELKEQQRAGDAARPTWPCWPVEVPPTVDGRSDEAVWQAGPGRRVVLRPVEDRPAGPRTEASVCCDDKTLYLMVRCPGSPDKPPSADPPARDADFSRADHVQVLIDLDRDFTSYYWLAVDARGRQADACLGCVGWDGAWQAAVGSMEGGWAVEIAVPFSTLGWWSQGRPPAGTTWCVNVVRSRPGEPVEAWSHPADLRPRAEGMGYLQFVQPTEGKSAGAEWRGAAPARLRVPLTGQEKESTP